MPGLSPGEMASAGLLVRSQQQTALSEQQQEIWLELAAFSTLVSSMPWFPMHGIMVDLLTPGPSRLEIQPQDWSGLSPPLTAWWVKVALRDFSVQQFNSTPSMGML